MKLSNLYVLKFSDNDLEVVSLEALGNQMEEEFEKRRRSNFKVSGANPASLHQLVYGKNDNHQYQVAHFLFVKHLLPLFRGTRKAFESNLKLLTHLDEKTIAKFTERFLSTVDKGPRKFTTGDEDLDYLSLCLVTSSTNFSFHPSIIAQVSSDTRSVHLKDVDRYLMQNLQSGDGGVDDALNDYFRGIRATIEAFRDVRDWYKNGRYVLAQSASHWRYIMALSPFIPALTELLRTKSVDANNLLERYAFKVPACFVNAFQAFLFMRPDQDDKKFMEQLKDFVKGRTDFAEFKSLQQISDKNGLLMDARTSHSMLIGLHFGCFDGFTAITVLSCSERSTLACHLIDVIRFSSRKTIFETYVLKALAPATLKCFSTDQIQAIFDFVVDVKLPLYYEITLHRAKQEGLATGFLKNAVLNFITFACDLVAERLAQHGNGSFWSWQILQAKKIMIQPTGKLKKKPKNFSIAAYARKRSRVEDEILHSPTHKSMTLENAIELDLAPIPKQSA